MSSNEIRHFEWSKIQLLAINGDVNQVKLLLNEQQNEINIIPKVRQFISSVRIANLFSFTIIGKSDSESKFAYVSYFLEKQGDGFTYTIISSY